MKIIFYIAILIFITSFLFIKNNRVNKKLYKKNQKISNFKKNQLSKESNIKKIYLREDERINLNPDINIKVNIYDKEYEIKNKTNIHRARLAKFKKSKLNGEYIFLDKNKNVYKIVNGIKKYL